MVASLRDVQELGTDVQLKSLQVILVMVTSYAAVQGPTLFEAILVCFRLHKAKDVVVNNAAAASLRQICIELFDKVILEAKQPGTLSSVFIWVAMRWLGAPPPPSFPPPPRTCPGRRWAPAGLIGRA